jgi:hypothetical protein
MAKFRSKSLFLAMALTVGATAAHAQATRTWVSGVGDDVNPCSRTAPCKTWAGAISKTASGGIIDALDPGGFGAVTVTKPITLEGNGTLASILSSGVNGVIVNITSGTNRNVVLRNILIDGSGVTLGTNGVRFIAGDGLLIDNCSLKAFSGSAVDFENDLGTGRLIIHNSVISQAATNGVLVKPLAGATAARATIEGSNISLCGQGVRAEDKSDVTVYHSVISNNTGGGVFSFSAAANGTVIVVDHSEASHNGGSGLRTSGANAIMRVSDTVIVGNQTGVDHAGGGTLESFLNNVFTLNSTQGTFTGSVTGGLQ